MLGSSPWGVRDSIPLTPPQTIRALDSVQRLFAAGRPSAGLADTLARQGISYLAVRNDLDPDTSRSARPILVHRAVDGSPGLRKVAQFGAPVGPGTLSGFVADSGLRPRYPAVEIYRVTGGGDVSDPATPYLVDADRLARVDGGPEALLRLDERRRLLGQPPLGPALLTADAGAAGLPLAPGAGVTVTDTPVARETDYGRVDQHSSAIRAPATRGTPTTGCRTIPSRARSRWPARGPAGGSPCRARRRIPPPCPTSPRRPPRPPRSTGTPRPPGCPTRCRPPSASGCGSISTTP
ncbi:hypothetical protein I548_2241 [Mycobacterium intracellulare]|nr:hypothetical protein I548_2241 [Mycobacterium intracellulare]